MLQTVATGTGLDWHMSNAYDFRKQVQLGGRMTNRQQQQNQQRAPSTRGSVFAQPHSNFGNPANSCDSPIRVSSGANVTESTYATAPFSSATSPGVATTGINNWQPKDTNRAPHSSNDNIIINTQLQQYAAEPWQASGAIRPSGGQYQQIATPRRSSRLPQGQPPTIQISPTYDTAFGTHIPQASHISQGELLLPTGSQYQQYWSPVDTTFPMATYDAPPQQISDTPMPVSPVSHHSNPQSRHVTPLPESIVRKRSYSEVSQGHGSNPSINETSPDAYSHHHEQQHQQQEQQNGPRKSRTIKRANAPMNENHKYFCDVSPDCAGLVFDRKCEWGKHMDKHDRPYRCPHPTCAKLQGFTYSGGLLRHEREVHHKHGGPKALLMCPHPTCKRHTDKGFTRKENLQEHIRRVHPESNDSGLPDQRPLEIAPDLDQLEQPASALSNGPSADELYVVAALNGDSKRRRSFTHEEQATDELSDLRELVKRLKTENEAKSVVIHQLKEEARAQSLRIVSLEHDLQRLQPPGR